MLVGIAELSDGQNLIGVDLDDRQIGFLVGADQLSVVQHAWRIRVDSDPDAVGLFDHVAIGDDVALGIHDHAGSQRTFADGTLVSALAAEETVEEIVKGILLVASVLIRTAAAAAWLSLDRGLRVDVNDAGF